MSDQDLGVELSKLRIDRSKKGARRGGLRWMLVLALLALGAGGFVYYSKAHAPVPVKVARAERDQGAGGAEENTALLTASGYVIPRHKVEVSSKIIGRVDDLLVKRGDRVKQGDVLLRLEDKEYAAQVKVAEAQLGNARARLAEMRAGSRPEEIEAAKAALASAQATLKGATQDLARIEKLAGEDVVSKQELDRIRTSHGVAQANVKSAQQNAELAEKGPRKEQIDAALAQERQAEANLNYARTLLDQTVIRAPITGTILEKLAEKGELLTNINFGGTRGAKSSVVSMADLSDLQVEIDLNENDLSKAHLGQKTEIRLDSNPDVVFKGEVDEIAPQADRQKATVQVKVRIVNPSQLVRPEVNARVTFLSDAPAKAARAASGSKIWIPRAALVEKPEGKLVYIASDGVAIARPVKVGAEGAKGIEITEGLAGTEMLIVEPLDRIANGTKIKVAP